LTKLENNGKILKAVKRWEVTLMCYKELRKIMKSRKISQEGLAQLLGINYAELNKKLCGEVEFTLWEIKCISQIFSLKKWQIMHIFFNKKFPKGNGTQGGMVNDEEFVY